LKYSPPNEFPYYEVVKPHVFRVGIEPNSTLIIDGEVIPTNQNNFKKFNYVVLGDATTVEGIKAPYNEEDTKQIFKVERVESERCILDFWINHPNQDHYSGIPVTLQEFEES